MHVRAQVRGGVLRAELRGLSLSVLEHALCTRDSRSGHEVRTSVRRACRVGLARRRGQVMHWAGIPLRPLAINPVSGAAEEEGGGTRGYLQEAGAGVARHAARRVVAQHAPPGRAALRPRLRPGASSVRRHLVAAQLSSNRSSARLPCILLSVSGCTHNQAALELTTPGYAISTLTASDSSGQHGALFT